MTVGVFELYEGVVSIGILAEIAFVLYSDRFLVVHQEFLLLIAVGIGLSITAHVVFLVYWPNGLHVADLLFLLALALGLYSLVADQRDTLPSLPRRS